MKDRGYYRPVMLQEYKQYGHVVGEIDLYYKVGKYILLFEIKESDTCRNYNKADRQMKRASCVLFNNYRVFKFFAHNKEGGGYEIKWIKGEQRYTI